VSSSGPTYTKPILVVDDDKALLETIKEFLNHGGYQVLPRDNPASVVEDVRERGIEIVISDIQMPGINGLDLLDRLKEVDPSIVVIAMTAYGSEKIAVEIMKRGAYDYLSKPFCMDEFLVVVGKATEHIDLIRRNQALTEQVLQNRPVDEMVGESPRMVQIKELIRRVGASDVTVLITGESGTGKELVAQSVVNHSTRAGGPFVKINCAALPENLLESELFGHEKGSFTGAHARQIGKFEMASGGTVFLDEIGDMSFSTQTKLLRVLQERCFERVGGKGIIRVDLRVLAATNKDLQTEIRKGNFRDDLYYRLNVIEIRVPPLRERKEDIPLLLDHFLDECGRKYGKPRRRITGSSLLKLCNYHWPGNIRQLKNYMERVTVLELDSDLDRDIDSMTGGGGASTPQQKVEVVLESLRDAEFRYIQHVLELTKGNRTQAAQILKIDAKTLRAKLKKSSDQGAEN